QAQAGQAVYTEKCAVCHGSRLRDGVATPLVGVEFVRSWAPPRTLDDLFFTIRTTMPKNAGGTLTDAEYLSVLAYMLQQNGYPAGNRELTGESKTLAALSLSQTPAALLDDRGPAQEYIVGRGGSNPRASGPTDADLLAAESHGRDWLMRERDYAGTRY